MTKATAAAAFGFVHTVGLPPIVGFGQHLGHHRTIESLLRLDYLDRTTFTRKRVGDEDRLAVDSGDSAAAECQTDDVDFMFGAETQ